MLIFPSDPIADKGACRLAFHGKVHETSETASAVRSWLRVFRTKTKEGAIERPLDTRSAIAKGLFKKETDSSLFLGRTVVIPELDGVTARIDSMFGKSGKFKIVLSKEVATPAVLSGKKIQLHFKQFIFQKTAGIVQ